MGTERQGRKPRTATMCIHGDRAPGSAGSPVVPPVVRSTIYRLDDETYELRRSGNADRARCYARETNPTVEHVEGTLAALEGAERALVFSSGMAALHALLMSSLEKGDRVIAFRQLYGGSLSLFGRLFPKLGVELALVDANDLDALRGELDERTRLVYCESISNPLTVVADLPVVAEVVHGASEKALVAVDATLATPLGQRPLELGANLVFHSATKYLGGHTDLMGGVLSGSDELVGQSWKWRTSAGGCMDPEGAFLLDRGLKTLPLRMKAHAENALAVARFLDGHDRVERVHFCGLEGDAFHPVAQRVLALPGGLLSFVVVGGDDAALAFLRRLRVITEAASLGGVESIANRPRDLSHVGLSEEERRRAGIAPGLIRLAVGLEDQEDLIEDLGQALA